MSETLQEIVARLALDPLNARGFTFAYQRGHDLSGITRLAVSDGTAFTLNANNPRQQRSLVFTGNLSSRAIKGAAHGDCGQQPPRSPLINQK